MLRIDDLAFRNAHFVSTFDWPTSWVSNCSIVPRPATIIQASWPRTTFAEPWIILGSEISLMTDATSRAPGFWGCVALMLISLPRIETVHSTCLREFKKFASSVMVYQRNIPLAFKSAVWCNHFSTTG